MTDICDSVAGMPKTFPGCTSPAWVDHHLGLARHNQDILVGLITLQDIASMACGYQFSSTILYGFVKIEYLLLVVNNVYLFVQELSDN